MGGHGNEKEKPSQRKEQPYEVDLRLPDLEVAKTAVINSLLAQMLSAAIATRSTNR
jgi:hypothetical protein